MPATTCPKCKTPLTYEPELAGQVIACPACAQKLRAPAAASPGTAAARFKQPPAPAPTPQAPEPEPSFPTLAPTKPAPDPQPPAPAFAGGGRSGAPAFRPREYPALRIIIMVLYVFAGLVVAQFLLWLFFLLSTSGRNLLRVLQYDTSGTSALFGIIGFAIMIVISLVFHGACVVLFVGSAESIKLWIDIQRNTQEAVHYARLAAA